MRPLQAWRTAQSLRSATLLCTPRPRVSTLFPLDLGLFRTLASAHAVVAAYLREGLVPELLKVAQLWLGDHLYGSSYMQTPAVL